MSVKTLARLVAAAVLAAVLAACGPHASDAQAGRSAAASVTANPQFVQAKALVRHCFAGTPVQQARQIHLVFLSSSTGKNGPAVIAARMKLGTCLGISKADEQPFINDAVTAAEHGHLLRSHANRVAYFEATLPQLVLKYSNAATASPSAAGSAA
jgi:hypothetical protein